MLVAGGVVEEGFCELGGAAEAVHGGSGCFIGLVEHVLCNKINKLYSDDNYCFILSVDDKFTCGLKSEQKVLTER